MFTPSACRLPHRSLPSSCIEIPEVWEFLKVAYQIHNSSVGVPFEEIKTSGRLDHCCKFALIEHRLIPSEGAVERRNGWIEEILLITSNYLSPDILATLSQLYDYRGKGKKIGDLYPEIFSELAEKRKLFIDFWSELKRS